MIYITGDTHGEFSKLSNTNWPVSTYMTREDYIIVTGDFGLIFNPVQTKDEIWWTKWIAGKPWTLLFVDGNHDNHPKLNDLPRELKFGSDVGIVSDSIFHLRRGEIYTIEGRTFLAFGGAASIDKVYRTPGVSWWPEEIPSYAEMDHCLNIIEKNSYHVDIILAHTCPDPIAPIIAGYRGLHLHEDPTQKMLNHITTVCEFSHYFCGHFHVNMDYGRYHFLYTKIVDLDVVIGEYNNGDRKGWPCDDDGRSVNETDFQYQDTD